MKKKTRKLSLHRETIRHLSNGEIRGVLGGTEDTSALCIDATFCDCGTGGCAEPTHLEHTCGTVHTFTC